MITSSGCPGSPIDLADGLADLPSFPVLGEVLTFGGCVIDEDDGALGLLCCLEWPSVSSKIS